MAEPRQLQPGEEIFGILMLLLALFLCWQSYEISGFSALSSPGAFPLAASAAMLIAAITIVAHNRHAKKAAAAAELGPRGSFTGDVTPTNVVVFAGFVIAYAAMLDNLGFLPASFLFLLAGIKFLHRASIGFTFAVTLGSLLTIYILFRLIFTVVLPEGIMPERDILAWFGNLFSGGGE